MIFCSEKQIRALGEHNPERVIQTEDRRSRIQPRLFSFQASSGFQRCLKKLRGLGQSSRYSTPSFAIFSHHLPPSFLSYSFISSLTLPCFQLMFLIVCPGSNAGKSSSRKVPEVSLLKIRCSNQFPIRSSIGCLKSMESGSSPWKKRGSLLP